MQIETWPIDRPQPYDKNPRLNDDAVAVVARSIQEFGFRQPIVVDESDVVIIGHTRLKAAKQLGLSEVPVHIARGLSPEQVKALRIADNKTAEIAEWNLELLPIELSELQGMNFDLGMLGFDQDELARLLDPGVREGLCDPDEIPAPPDEAITKPGDLWILGEHRLLCGDSSKPADLDRLLDGQPIHLCNTDPPYNVKVEPRSNNAIAAGLSSFAKAEDRRPESGGKKGDPTTSVSSSSLQTLTSRLLHHQSMDVARHPEKSKPTQKKLRAKDRPLANDFVSDEEFDRLLDAWFGNIARVLVPGRGFYIWGGYANCANYPPFLKKHGLYLSQAIIWDKQHPVLTRKDFMGAHEWCFYGWKEGAAHRFYGPNNATDLWHIKKIPPQRMEHLTAKPAELAVRAMQYSSVPGENVLDLFGGSGSTLIGAERTGRKAFLMELDPLYCDVIVDRFQRFTGKPGVLERTGKSPIPMKPREENLP